MTRLTKARSSGAMVSIPFRARRTVALINHRTSRRVWQCLIWLGRGHSLRFASAGTYRAACSAGSSATGSLHFAASSITPRTPTPGDFPVSDTAVSSGPAATLKAQPGRSILTDGSSQLVHALLAHDLVDELHLLLYPLTLGSGKRLLPSGVHSTFALRSATPYPSGVVGLHYTRQTR